MKPTQSHYLLNSIVRVEEGESLPPTQSVLVGFVKCLPATGRLFLASAGLLSAMALGGTELTPMEQMSEAAAIQQHTHQANAQAGGYEQVLHIDHFILEHFKFTGLPIDERDARRMLGLDANQHEVTVVLSETSIAQALLSGELPHLGPADMALRSATQKVDGLIQVLKHQLKTPMAESQGVQAVLNDLQGQYDDRIMANFRASLNDLMPDRGEMSERELAQRLKIARARRGDFGGRDHTRLAVPESAQTAPSQLSASDNAPDFVGLELSKGALASLIIRKDKMPARTPESSQHQRFYM